MESKSFRRKIYALVVLGILIIGCIGLSISYAFFLASVKGNDDATAMVIETGEMRVTFTYGNIIGTTENMIPGMYFEIPFTVENTGTVPTKYDIYLNNISNTFVDKNDLVYTLTSTDGVVNIGETVVPSTGTKIASNIPIGIPGIHHYTLRVLFKEDGTNQDDNKGASFRASVDLEEKEHNPYVYATTFNGYFGIITSKSEGETTIPTRVISPYNGAENPNNNYLRYTLVNDEIDTTLIPETCVYYEELGELCLKNNDYENSLNKVFDYFDFDKNTWSYTSDDIGDHYSIANEKMNAYCTIRDGTDYHFVFSLPGKAGSEVFVGQDGVVYTLSYYLNHYCSIRNDGGYDCYQST